MSEEMVNLSVYDTLSLTRDNPMSERLKTLPRPPFFMNPGDALPIWLTRPLNAKMPMVGVPRRFQVPYTRGTLGDNLVHSLDPNHFVIYDPHGYDIKYGYAPLHDKHLKAFFKKPVTKALVEATNEVRNGRTVCSLKEYNDYRKYIHKIQLHFVTQELHNEENLRKEEIGIENFINKAKKEAKDKWNKRLKDYMKEKRLQVEREEQRKKQEKCRRRLKRVEERSAVVKKRLEDERVLRSIKWNAYQKKMTAYFKELKDDQRRLGIASRKKWLFEAALNARRKEVNHEENRLKRDIQLEINWERMKKRQMIKIQKDKLCLEQYNRCMEIMRERRERGYNKDLEIEEMLTLPGMDNLRELRVTDTLVDNYSEEFSKAMRGAKFFVNPRAKQFTLEKALRKYIKHTESPKERLRKAFIVKPIKEAMDLIIRRTVTHYAFVKCYEIIKDMLKGAERSAEKIKLSQPLRKLLLVEYEKYGPRSNFPYETLLHFGEDGLSHCICDHRLVSKDKLWWPCTLCRTNKPDNAFTVDEEFEEEYYESLSSDDSEVESDESPENDASEQESVSEDHREEECLEPKDGKTAKTPDVKAKKHDLKITRKDEESKGGKMVAFPEEGGTKKLASVLPEQSRDLEDSEKFVDKKSNPRLSDTSKKVKKRRKGSKGSKSSATKQSKKSGVKIRKKSSADKKLSPKLVTETHRKSGILKESAFGRKGENPVDKILKAREFSLKSRKLKLEIHPKKENVSYQQTSNLKVEESVEKSIPCLPKQDQDPAVEMGQCNCNSPSSQSLISNISLMSITSDNRLRFIKRDSPESHGIRKKATTGMKKGFVQGKCRCWKRVARNTQDVREEPHVSSGRVIKKSKKRKTRWVGKVSRDGEKVEDDANPKAELSYHSPEIEEDEVLVAICQCGTRNCVGKIVLQNEEQFDRLVKSLEEGEETKKIFLDKEIIKKCKCKKCADDSKTSLTKDLKSASSRSSVRIARANCRCLKKNLGAFEEKKADKLAYIRKIVGAGEELKREREESLTGKVLRDAEKRADSAPRKKLYRKKFREPLIPKKKNRSSAVADLFKRSYPDTDVQKLYVNDEGALYSLDRRARRTIIVQLENLKVDQTGQKYFHDAVGNRYFVDVTGRVYAIGESGSKFSLFCQKGMLTVNPQPKEDPILARVRPSILCAVPEGAEEPEESSRENVGGRNKYEYIDENASDVTQSQSQEEVAIVDPSKEESVDSLKVKTVKDKPSVKLAASLERIEGLTPEDMTLLSGRVPPPRMPIKRPLNSLVNEVPRHKAIDKLFIQRNKFEQCARIISRRLLLYSYCKATRLKEFGMDKLEELNQGKDKNRMKIDHLVKALAKITAHYPLKLVTSRRLSVYIDSLAKSMLNPNEFNLFDAGDESRKPMEKYQLDKYTDGASTTASSRTKHRSQLTKLFEPTSELQGWLDTTGIISKAFVESIHSNRRSTEEKVAPESGPLKPEEPLEEEEEF